MSDSVWSHRWHPPGSPIPGILQARTLEWVAISFSNAWKWKVKGKSLSRVWLFMTPWTAAFQAPPSMGFFRQEYWSGVPLPSLAQKLHLLSTCCIRFSISSGWCSCSYCHYFPHYLRVFFCKAAARGLNSSKYACILCGCSLAHRTRVCMAVCM